MQNTHKSQSRKLQGLLLGNRTYPYDPYSNHLDGGEWWWREKLRASVSFGGENEEEAGRRERGEERSGLAGVVCVGLGSFFVIL